MQAIICQEPGRLEKIEIADSIPGPGQVLLQIKAIGICGTDLHAYAGNQAYFTYPRILGHELGARVLEVGNGVDHLKSGDKAVILPYFSCGKCIACRNGQPNCCQKLNVFGVHSDGGMKEKIVVDAVYVRQIVGLEFEEIALIEPLAIGAHALSRASLRPGEWIVVVGCGPIGLGIMAQALHAGCKVIGVDVVESRLNFAKEAFGVLTVPADRAIAFIKEQTGGDLATAVFDATGYKPALETGIEYMAHGGRYVLVGLSKGDLCFSHPAIHAKETTILCSRNATWLDFDKVIAYLKTGGFPASKYISHQVPFEHVVDTFADWLDPEAGVIKAMATLNG